MRRIARGRCLVATLVVLGLVAAAHPSASDTTLERLRAQITRAATGAHVSLHVIFSMSHRAPSAQPRTDA